MSLFSKILQALRSWRPGRAQQPIRRASVTLEQLDHRQLLSVNFTGNVPVDFPATQSPGVVVLPLDLNNPQTVVPVIPPVLKPVIPVSGAYIQDLRVSYDASDDTLYVGIDQPASGLPGQGEVIAEDSDDNGNSATVNPAVLAIDPSFVDFPDMQGAKFMGIFLDFTGSGTPQIVAGYSEVSPIGNTPSNPLPNLPPKPYEVAVADPSTLPVFGAELPQYTGSVFLQNSPTTPNMEFSITHFSQLYQMETGKPMTSSSEVSIGGQAGTAAPDLINDMFFPQQSFNIGAATLPGTCPPQSPTIYVNPHEHRIIDTLHRDLIRVTIDGTSGFNVKEINPSTVTLDGVHSIAHITRKVRRDEFPIATYVFVADQLHLPPGLNNVTLSGTLNNGLTTFSSSRAVLNIPDSARISGPLHRYMGGGTIYRALSKIEAKHPGTVAIPSTNATAVSVSNNPAPHGLAKLKVNYSPVVATASNSATKAGHAEKARTVVKIHRTEAASEASSKLPTLLRHSMSEYLHHA
jgi:hypothetical protein